MFNRINIKKRTAAFLDAIGDYFAFRVVLILLGLVIGAAVLLLMVFGKPQYTHTTDIADYGEFGGTGSDDFVKKYIFSFFPAEIEDSFKDITYSYKAETTDVYGFEAYLEFKIEDKNAFDAYIAAITDPGNWQETAFCPGFMEYRIENVLTLDEPDESDDPASIFYHGICQAKIRKVLYSQETQTVIYVALGVYDGNGIGTNYLNAFFSRFDIDPVDYAKGAYAGFDTNAFKYAID